MQREEETDEVKMNLPAAETAGYPKPKEKPCFLIF